MTQKNIYMDNNATTPLHPEVAVCMTENLGLFGNPSSIHEPGRQAQRKVEEARESVASLINARPEEIVFTGSGSEGNNTVLKLFPEGSRIVTSAIEHPCVLNTAEYLGTRGRDSHFLNVDASGKIILEEYLGSLKTKTDLVSIMHGNNEIGTVQDIGQITQAAHEAGALMHTDAVQTAGKVEVDVQKLGVDYLTLSAHKIYGPKGVGALYIRKGSPFEPLLHGGHQEKARRAGTHNTLGILGFGKAAELARLEMAGEAERLWSLRESLRKGIADTIDDVIINGHPTDCLPGTLDVSFLGAEGESILLYLDLEGIHVSTGSACATGSLDPSHVLLAIGLDHEYAHGSIRFSLGRENSGEDVEYILDKLPGIITKIRKISTRYGGGFHG